MHKLTPDELATLLVKEKLLPLDQEFCIAEADDPIWAATMIHKLEPVRRRQFFCEKVEESYQQLLAAAKDGPDKEKARATLSLAIDSNLRWARNNIAGFGLECEEFPMFSRIDELSVQYQKALQDLNQPSPGVTLDTVAEKVNSLHVKADAIHSDTRELKVSIPATIEGQASTIRDREAEISRLKAALAQRLYDMAAIYQRVAPPDMNIFVAFMREGNQVRAAESLGIKEQTLRARVSQWPRNGAAYRRLVDLYQWRKESGRSPMEVPFFENLLHEGTPAPDVDARIMTDIAEILRDMNPMNMEKKKEVLLTQYLKEYVAT
jgi:DNA-binding protein Fis